MSQRYLTFDCYGTLVDWKRGIEESLRGVMGDVPTKGKALLDAYIAAEREEEITYKKYREVLCSAAIRLAATLGGTMSSEVAGEFAASVPTWPLFPDTREALHDFGRMGFKRYILSNVDTDLLVSTIEDNRLEIDGFVTAEEVRSYKPRRAHWARFFEKTGAKREDTLHVAQSIFHDIIPAQDMGLSSAWVNRYREALPSGAEPLYIADALDSLGAFLS